MDKEKNANKIEREYIIPLRREWHKVPRYKRANKAVKAIKEFLAQHMKVRDRDLKKIRVDKYLNEEIWHRGIKNPPARIKVKATKNGEIVRVELFEMPENLKFKKLREEKIEKKAEEIKTKNVHAHVPGEEHKHETPEEKTEEKERETHLGEAELEKKIEVGEKKAAVVEAGKEFEKQAARKEKHQTKQSKQPKHQFRKALKK